VGEPLHRGGQRPGIGGGDETGKAEDRGARRGGGFDRQESGPQPRPVAARAPGWDWRAELVPESGKSLGLTIQFVAAGWAGQLGQGVRQRAQLRRGACWQLVAREQGGQGRLADRGYAPAAWPCEIRHFRV
jgi:hypothetical protein